MLFALAVGLLLATVSSGAPSRSSKYAEASGYAEPLCVSHSSLCADVYTNPGDEYVGHDEPSIEFKSGEPTSMPAVNHCSS